MLTAQVFSRDSEQNVDAAVLVLLNVLPGNKDKKNVNSDLISVIILKLLIHENHQTFLVKRIGTSVHISTRHLVCPDLFFCKQLSLVVYR